MQEVAKHALKVVNYSNILSSISSNNFNGREGFCFLCHLDMQVLQNPQL